MLKHLLLNENIFFKKYERLIMNLWIINNYWFNDL